MTRFVSCLAIFGIAAAAQQNLTTPDEMPLFRAGTQLVEAYVTVFDKRGNPAPNIPADRFHVVDGGRPQALAAFEGAAEQLSCAILLDVTGSMEEFLPALKYAAIQFVDNLRDDEFLSVYAFNNRVKLSQAFTTDKKTIKQAIMRTTAAGGTALFDSLSLVSRDLETRKGKKAIVVFTDGDDNASALTAAGASRQAKRAGVPVYAIVQGSALEDPKLTKTLEGLATSTGGLSFRLTNPKKINEVFTEIARNLKHTYLLSWKPPDESGAEWRPIKISVSGLEGAQIRTREGYWAQ